MEAALLPHRGVVFIDDDASGQQWLTNTVTHEHVKLPLAHKWAMDFDEDGFGIIAPPPPLPATPSRFSRRAC